MSSGLFACCVNPISPCPTTGWVSVAGVLDAPFDGATPYQLFLVSDTPTGAFAGRAGYYTYYSSLRSAWEFCRPIRGQRVSIIGGQGTCDTWCFDGADWGVVTSGGGTYTGTVIGTGGTPFDVYAGMSGTEFRFRSLVAGTNVTLSMVGDRIRISSTASGSGEVNTGNNLGAAGASRAAVYKTKTGAALQFRRLRSTHADLTISEGTDYVDIGLSRAIPEATTVANVGAGTGIWAGLTATVNQLKSLKVQNGLSITPSATEITFGIDWASVLSNVGAGAQVFKTGTAVQLRTMVAGAGMSITQNANDITIAGTYSATNVGASGLGVFKALSGSAFQFYKLVAGTNMTISQVGDTLVFESTGVGPGAPGTVAGAEVTAAGTVVPASGDWVTVPFDATLLSNPNITFSGSGDEATFNASGNFVAHAKVTLVTGSGRAQHAVRISYHDGIGWATLHGSLAYGFTPNDANDLQTVHTGPVIVAATAGHKIKVEVMATSGTLDCEILDEATSLVIYSM